MQRASLMLRNRNVLAGLFFVLVAVLLGYGAQRLAFGTTIRMGPGYFPLVLSGLLALLGLITIVNGLREASPETAIEPVAWSRMALTCGAALFFALCLEGLGLPLAVFGTVLIAASGSRRFRLVEGVALAIGIAVLSWVLFRVLLGLQFQMLGSWIS